MTTEATATPPAPAPAPAPAPTSVPSVTPSPAAENRVPQSVVDRVTAEKWEAIRAKDEAERKAKQLEATLAEVRNASGGTTSAAPAVTAPAAPAASTERLTPEALQKMVAEQAALQEFNRQCNESAEKGKAAHADFDKTLNDLTRMSPIYNPQAGGPVLPESFVEAALETGEAHEVIYALGKDAAEAERILRLPPARQAVAVAKYHDKLVAARTAALDEGDGEDGASTGTGTGNSTGNDTGGTNPPARPKVSAEPPNTSRARPIRGATGAGSAGARSVPDVMDTEKTSMKDWIALREKQVQEARNSGVRRR